MGMRLLKPPNKLPLALVCWSRSKIATVPTISLKTRQPNGLHRTKTSSMLSLVPDRGNALREIASLLYFHGVDPTAKKYLGLEGWNDTALAREQSLVGGVYAVPPVGPITQFEARYASRFGATPNLQSMAVYDSILMAAELATLTAINSLALWRRRAPTIPTPLANSPVLRDLTACLARFASPPMDGWNDCMRSSKSPQVA